MAELGSHAAAPPPRTQLSAALRATPEHALHFAPNVELKTLSTELNNNEKLIR